MLGICYGAQLMASELGGHVQPTPKREYGPATVTIGTEDGLFVGLDRTQPVWMSHGDTITALPEGFEATAQTDSTPYAGLVDHARNLYGIQFHPEVAHTPHGRDVLRNFVVGVAGITPVLDRRQLHRVDRRRDPRRASTATPGRSARTAGSSARSRAASTPPSRRPSSIAPWATG